VTPRGTSARPTARLTTLVVLAGLVCAAGAMRATPLGSAALLTDSGATAPATVSSGNVSLALSAGVATNSWTGSVSLTPGGAAYAGITVTNDGASRLRYAVTALSTSALSADLVLDVVTIPTASACTSTTFAAGTAVAGPVAFGSSPALALVGSAATGADAGDRTLLPAASERLCAQVTFPYGTGLGAAARGTSAATTFTFAAENA